MFDIFFSGTEFVELDLRKVRLGNDHLLRVVHLQLFGSKLPQTNPEEEATKELEQRTLKAAIDRAGHFFVDEEWSHAFAALLFDSNVNVAKFYE